jgi:hypothetical protein
VRRYTSIAEDVTFSTNRIKRDLKVIRPDIADLLSLALDIAAKEYFESTQWEPVVALPPMHLRVNPLAAHDGARWTSFISPNPSSHYPRVNFRPEYRDLVLKIAKLIARLTEVRYPFLRSGHLIASTPMSTASNHARLKFEVLTPSRITEHLSAICPDT